MAKTVLGVEVGKKNKTGEMSKEAKVEEDKEVGEMKEAKVGETKEAKVEVAETEEEEAAEKMEENKAEEEGVYFIIIQKIYTCITIVFLF